MERASTARTPRFPSRCSMSERIAGVVLAAGGSSRLGRPRQLLTVGGEPLVRRAAVQALAACDEVLVVVGAVAEQVAHALAGLPLRVVLNRAWADGMGS